MDLTGHRVTRALTAIAVAGLSLAAMQRAGGSEAPGTLAPVIARVAPSVALLRCWMKNETPSALQEFFDRGPTSEREEAATAFVVDAAAGLLATSDYVVRGKERCEVELGTGERRAATPVGFDEATGVGLLRITPEGLVAAAWSENEALVGDPALLVAYIAGKGPIATRGMVSGRNLVREFDQIESLFLDVAVNFGAAGGIVTTLDGKIIGMAYGMYGKGADPYANLGVAVPAAEMRPIIAALARDGKVRRGRIGVTVQEIPLHGGVQILEVHDGSPAAGARLKPGEKIIALNGQQLEDDLALRRHVARAPIGTALTLTVRGADGAEREVTLATTAPDD